MLVLTRKRGERLLIGEGADSIVVEVLEVNFRRHGPTQVKLGIKAPQGVIIRRAELPPEAVESMLRMQVRCGVCKARIVGENLTDGQASTCRRCAGGSSPSG